MGTIGSEPEGVRKPQWIDSKSSGIGEYRI